LLNAWDPLVYVDLHVTDGAKFQHDISLMVAPTLAGDSELNEGRSSVALEGSWRAGQRDVPAGSLFVPIAQP
jgi:hypothetical protein